MDDEPHQREQQSSGSAGPSILDFADEPVTRIVIGIALVALIAAVFAPVRGHQFVDLEDWANILYNPDIQVSSIGQAIATAFTRMLNSMWTPLSMLSLQLDWALYGSDPAGFLITNVVLHALATLVLFAFLFRITGAVGASAFVAAVFAVHPLHVESVAWASERRDVLSGLFWMLTLFAYCNYVEQPQRRSRYALVLLCMSLGLLAKSTLVTLPFVLLLLDYWPLGRLDRSAIREKIPLFAIVAVYAVVAIQAPGAAESTSLGGGVPIWARLLNGMNFYVVYLEKRSGRQAWRPITPFPWSRFSSAEPSWVRRCLVRSRSSFFSFAVRDRTRSWAGFGFSEPSSR